MFSVSSMAESDTPRRASAATHSAAAFTVAAVSWPVAAFVCGLLVERFWTRYDAVWGTVANIVGGIGVVYAIGVPVLKAVTGLPWSDAVWLGAAVFIPGDVIKAVIAAVIAVQVRRSYPVIERPRRASAVR